MGQWVPNYVLHPGNCFRCGGTHTPAYDFERTFPDFQYEGNIYVCAQCVTDVYSELLKVLEGRGMGPGLVPIRELEDAQAAAARLVAEVVQLRQALEVTLPDVLDKLIPLVRPKETDPPATTPVPEQPAPPKRKERAA